ncbi:MAG: HAD family phosphatase [bacterium]
MTEPRALIFDFNGVLLDDEPIHNRNLQTIFAEEGIPLSLEEIRTRCHGRGDWECFTFLLEEAGRDFDSSSIEKLIANKSCHYKQSISQHLPLVPGVEAFLSHWFGRVPLALASGALLTEIEFVLERSGLARFFTVMANTAEAGIPKPDPAVYNLALDRLRQSSSADLQAGDCLVFEDSAVGMHAALAAGMRCVGVATSADPGELQKAELVIHDFLDPQLARLLEMR